MTVAGTLADRPVGTPRIFGLFLRLLSANWTWGQLDIVLPNGNEHRLVGPRPGHRAVLRIKSYRMAGRVLKGGDIGFAEAYMAREFDTPHLAVLLETLANNYEGIRRLFDGNRIGQVVNWIGHRLNRNSREGARRNIHAHYDLGNSFYALWLDRTMTYSSGRYGGTVRTLEEAQTAKYASLARMMDLRAGETVLEIGCGWGGFAEYAAKVIGAKVTGITISREQYDYTRERMVRQGLSEQVDIKLIDYRDVQGQFDRVASIEMFEAVGQEYWPAYFGKVREVLRPGGRAGLQIITIRNDLFDGYNKRTDFIQKYIFPGGVLPSEESLASVVAGAGLATRAVERFGISYADTLAAWGRRFSAAWPDIQRIHDRFDDRFHQLWMFYLAYCEAGFRSRRIDVIQMAVS
ncbi:MULTISPECIES: SAM-dependent methyltransferase [unclassified Brevundimonas]|uniref:SAM-dependent methyltransferase n=1 Tax=unclassified Brevundimonas TaxID=2622653 RepID=UPI0025BED780|nr:MULTISPECIES: cyclopropane-fatty-acyl-phospholipid synthase family protein [unclassified Brevundimonas]